MSTPAWKRAALAHARTSALAPALVELLDAFGPAGEGSQPGPGAPAAAVDAGEVEAALAGEVDPDQAAMFGRRLAAVDAALGEGAADALLRALLRGRLREVLAGPRPRALRVRALADFVYSQHARLALGGGGPDVEALVADPRWRVEAPGVEAATVAGPSRLGPQRIHLLRLDPARVCLRALHRPAEVAAGEDLAAHSLRLGAVAALSGGFFLYSEADVAPHSRRRDPVGLLVDEGVVASPPVLARTALLEGPDGWRIAPVPPAATDLALGGWPVPWAEVEAVNRARAEVAEGAPGGAVAVVGDRVVAVAPPGQPLAVPLNGLVLRLRHPAPVAVGDPARWRLPGVRAAMAGGPLLVRQGQPIADLAALPLPSPQLVAEEFAGTAPPQTFSRDETGDRNLLPRLAVGLDDAGRLLVAAVDGRDLGGALGLTLAALARVMAALSCRTALNLDGGSSKRLVVRGVVVDRPSTEILGAELLGAGPAGPGLRPVHTAILVLPR